MARILRFLTSTCGWIFTIICSGVIIACVAGLLLFNHYTEDLPDYSTLEEYNPPTISRIYAKDGRLISEQATQNRTYTPLSVVPEMVIHAFLSAEDQNFYSHTGVDYRGIARAVFTNIMHYGDNRSMVGGSTITQQVVKNFLLTNERSLRRKVREAALAIRITNAYSKDRILELYLNEIYLGNRSYGIAAAAMNYFNRSLSELELEEIALLAALPKAPSNINPYKNYDRALERRNWVLRRMYDDSRISLSELQQARVKPIVLRKRDKQETIDAPYFAEEVRRFLTKELGEKVMKDGGLSVITTLDPKLQALADHALRKQLVEYDRRHGFRGNVGKLGSTINYAEELEKHPSKSMLIDEQKLAVVLELRDSYAKIGFSDRSTGALPMKLLSWTRRVMGGGTLGPAVNKPSDILAVGDVVIVGPIDDEQRKQLSSDQAKLAWDLQQVPLINGSLVASDPHSGKVLALSGGYSYAVSSFNRATQAKRQPGSSFKPFVYLSAFENGLTPSTRVLDAPIEITKDTGGEIWRPENYADSYLGPTTLRRGLEKSRNTMTVRLGQALGMKRIMEVGQRFGVYDKIQPNLSMVLGTLETTVIRLLNAYAILANGGRQVQPILVERVEDNRGNVIYQRDLRGCPTCKVDDASWDPAQLIPPSLFDTRERVVDARVAYQVVSLLEGVVKRGTAASAAGLPWALGGKTGTTNDSRDVWFMGISPDLVAGVFIGFDTPQPLGSHYTGSSLALPVFKDFIEPALAGSARKEFIAPSGIDRVKVDLDTGYPLEPWEADGRKTIWENFLRADIPVFKTESSLAVGELSTGRTSKLGMDDAVEPINKQVLLPWQVQNLSPAMPGADPWSYRQPNIQRMPPPTYIQPSVQPTIPPGIGTYTPQIAPPAQAPVRPAMRPSEAVPGQ